MPTKPKRLQVAFNVGLVALAVVVIIWGGVVSFAGLASTFANPVTGVMALSVIFIGAQLSVVRWHLLLAWQGTPMRYGQAWRISYISWFLGTILPGAAGADALRALYVHRDSTARGLAFISILLDRLLGLAALLVLAIGMLALASLSRHHMPQVLRTSMWIFLFGSLLGVVVLPFLAVVFNSKLRRWTRSLVRIRHIVEELDEAAKLALAVWHRQPLKLLWCLVLGIVGHIFVIASIVILANGSGISAPSGPELALAAALAVLINQLPLTPGGIGVGELGFAQLCLLMTPGGQAALYGSVILAFRVVTLVSYAPGAIALMSYRPERQRSMVSSTRSASESSKPG